MSKITEEDKNAQIKTIAQKIEDLQEELIEADQYVKEKEQIVDDAMSFIRTPDIFWNRANTKIRQDIQMLLFPNGIAYDFEIGFGTAEKIKSYLLIEDLMKNYDEKTDLVSLKGNGWNSFVKSIEELDKKLELIGIEQDNVDKEQHGKTTKK